MGDKKVSFISPPGWLDELGRQLNAESDVTPETDVIICMSISQMDKFERAIRIAPKAKKIYYQWDIYDWVWTSPRQGEYNYRKYIDLLRKCDVVFVPSPQEKKRTDKYVNSTVLKSFSLYEELDTKKGDYAYNILREIPDEQHGWFELACEEVGIPYVTSDRARTFLEYQEILAGARFLVSPYKQLSTGGLSLIEGYYNGKPCLCDGSGESGAEFYMGDRTTYFKGYEDLKVKLKEMYDNTPTVDKDHKEWVDKEYNVERMAEEMNHAIARL